MTVKMMETFCAISDILITVWLFMLTLQEHKNTYFIYSATIRDYNTEGVGDHGNMLGITELLITMDYGGKNDYVVNLFGSNQAMGVSLSPAFTPLEWQAHCCHQ